MYKCKECGCEFETKPDYCDCGNDEFELVVAQSESIINVEEKNKTNVVAEHQELKIQPAQQLNTNYSENFVKRQLSIKNNILRLIDPISGFIFATCLILSIVIAFYPVKIIETENVSADNHNQKTTKSIPAIDKFWNNSTEGLVAEPIKVEEPKIEINIPKQIQKVVSESKSSNPQVKTSNVKPSVSKTQTVNKPQVKPVTATKAVKPAQQTKTQPVQNKPVQTATSSVKPTAKTATQETKPAQTSSPQQPKTTVVTLQKNPVVSTVEQVNNAALKQELASYKISLRNTIGKKIDFTKVVGDGSCTVAFKIDSNGKLINRSFSKQSSNMTLNDAVYAAVMSTPTFNPPPSGYKNETLNLNIRFYSGNFEISLP
ncbi:TonB C-terminal domain-containing protein [bacterium]|nr:TonB C-terminal domain-containing protein [bacterium]